MEPGAEMRPGLEPGQLPVGPQEAVLDHVLGVVLVAGHAVGQPEGAPAVAFDQGAEGLAVALPGPGQDRGYFGIHPED